jgi:hypothetical protein
VSTEIRKSKPASAIADRLEQASGSRDHPRVSGFFRAGFLREALRRARYQGVARLLGLRRAVIEDVWISEEGEVVVAAGPDCRERDRCGVCRRRSAGFDLGDGRSQTW